MEQGWRLLFVAAAPRTSPNLTGILLKHAGLGLAEQKHPKPVYPRPREEPDSAFLGARFRYLLFKQPLPLLLQPLIPPLPFPPAPLPTFSVVPRRLADVPRLLPTKPGQNSRE